MVVASFITIIIWVGVWEIITITVIIIANLI